MKEKLIYRDWTRWWQCLALTLAVVSITGALSAVLAAYRRHHDQGPFFGVSLAFGATVFSLWMLLMAVFAGHKTVVLNRKTKTFTFRSRFFLSCFVYRSSTLPFAAIKEIREGANRVTIITTAGDLNLFVGFFLPGIPCGFCDWKKEYLAYKITKFLAQASSLGDTGPRRKSSKFDISSPDGSPLLSADGWEPSNSEGGLDEEVAIMVAVEHGHFQ